MAVDVADAVLITELRSKPAGRQVVARGLAQAPRGRDLHRRVASARVVGLEAASTSSRRRSPSCARCPHDAGSLGRDRRRDHAPRRGRLRLSILIGGVLGLAVARVRVLRAAIGSMITGLQTMPSVAWVPLGIVLFQLSESAILFVVILGAAPSIANGIIDGIDNVPPLLLRAGRVLGARGWSALRYVVDPRRAAVGRQRPQAGLGVRVAQPDGR